MKVIGHSTHSFSINLSTWTKRWMDENRHDGHKTRYNTIFVTMNNVRLEEKEEDFLISAMIDVLILTNT
jgi:hypothetical protein